MAKSYIRAPRRPIKPSSRPVDALAGEGSVAGKLKSQRQALESGDASMGNPVVGNSADEVLKRGYFNEGDDE